MICENGRIICREGPAEYTVYRTDPESEGVQRRGMPAAQYPVPMPARMQGTGITIIEDIIQSIETGGRPKASGEDGRAALETAIALRESHRRGGVRVALPIEDRSLGIRSLETYRDDIPARVRRMMDAQA